MTVNIEYSLKALAELLESEFSGDPDVVITGLATLSGAQQGQLSFYHNSLFANDLLATQASVVILHPKHLDKCPCNGLISKKPYATYAKASRLFEQEGNFTPMIHASAQVHPDAQLGENVRIEANVVIEEAVVLGEGVLIQANCVIGKGCTIGAGSRLYPNVTLYRGVKLGERAAIHASTVLGSDGFGYAHDGKKYLKISQLGGVSIGNDVDIGAGSCVDRGALEDTVIEDGVKIDNQVQIAHNVKIGANSIICGCSAIAGSSTIGKNCTIAGGVGIINHITIVDDVTVTALSLVNQNIMQKGVYSSGTGLSESKEWKRNIVRFRELEKMSKRISALEKLI